jgi:hypothetical protein
MLDLEMYLRLSHHHDVAFVDEVLLDVHVDEGTMGGIHFRDPVGTGPLAVLLERIYAVGLLLRSERAADDSYRMWLAERLNHLNSRTSEVAQGLLPGLGLDHAARLTAALHELDLAIPPKARVLLADERKLSGHLPKLDVIEFMVRDGQYWGIPSSDDEAIAEVQAAIDVGAAFFVVAWSAFWFLEELRGFNQWLDSHFALVASSSRVMVFDIRPVSGRRTTEPA